MRHNHTNNLGMQTRDCFIFIGEEKLKFHNIMNRKEEEEGILK